MIYSNWTFSVTAVHSLLFLQTSQNMKSSVSWDITPCGPLKVKQCFGGICHLSLQGQRICQARNWHESRWFCLPPIFTLVSWLAYSLTQKMEATCSSATSVDLQWTTQSYIPEDRTLYNQDCENLNSYIHKICLKIYDKRLLRAGISGGLLWMWKQIFDSFSQGSDCGDYCFLWSHQFGRKVPMIEGKLLPPPSGSYPFLPNYMMSHPRWLQSSL
jgi:hypothetical protein